MKNLAMVLAIIAMLVGCKTAEELGNGGNKPDEIKVLDVILLDAKRMSDGNIDVLLRPFFQYTNGSSLTVVVEEEWTINGEKVRICDYETISPTGGGDFRKEAKYSLRHVLPAGTATVDIEVIFNTLFQSGTKVVKYEKRGLPVFP